MSFDPSAQLFLGESGDTPGPVTDFPTGSNQEFKLPEGTSSGRLVINVKTSWFRNVWSGNTEGNGSVRVEVRFKVGPENKVEWLTPATTQFSSDGTGASTTGVGAATGDTLSATAVINGIGSLGETSSSNVNISPGGIGGSKTSGRTITLPAGSSETRSYNVRLTPAPLPETSQIFTAYFKVNSHVVEEKSETDLVVWYKGLPPPMRQSIEDGVTEFNITGHASTTNSGEYNRKLSARRGQRIKEILTDIAGSKAKINVKAPGYYEAEQFDNRTGQKVAQEDSSERYVTVSATYVARPVAKP